MVPAGPCRKGPADFDGDRCADLAVGVPDQVSGRRAALAAGDLTGDRTPDLAVGAPGRGAVQVLRGMRGRGLSGRGGTTVTAPPGAVGQFGWSLTVRRRDLLVGAPGAAGYGGVVTLVAAGRAQVLRLQGRGLIGYSLG